MYRSGIGLPRAGKPAGGTAACVPSIWLGWGSVMWLTLCRGPDGCLFWLKPFVDGVLPGFHKILLFFAGSLRAA